MQVWIIYRSRSRGTTVPWKRKCRDQSPLPISLGWWLRWEIPTNMISTRELGPQQITPKTKPQTQAIKNMNDRLSDDKKSHPPIFFKKSHPPPNFFLLETMPFSCNFQFEWKTRWRRDSSGGDCGASASIGRVVSLSIQAYGSRSLLVNFFRNQGYANVCIQIYIYHLYGWHFEVWVWLTCFWGW